LDPSGGVVELGLEFIDAAECAFDSVFELAGSEDAAVAFPIGGGRGQVLPEERMIDVTCSREIYFCFVRRFD
jgi:hypothetical protein